MQTTGPLTLLLAMAMAGCVAGTTPSSDRSIGPDPFVALQRNMGATQVKALAGEPDEIKSLQSTGLAGEVWIYRRKISESVIQVPIGTRDVPATNPITGQAITIAETVYENQVELAFETIELLLIDQRVIEWKRSRSTERAFR